MCIIIIWLWNIADNQVSVEHATLPCSGAHSARGNDFREEEPPRESAIPCSFMENLAIEALLASKKVHALT